MAIFRIQWQVTKTVLVRLNVAHILTKVGADWLIFVDAREQTKSNSAIFS